MRRRRSPEVIAGRVNADGSIAAGDGFTVQKTGTGLYAITIRGMRLVSATASYYGGYSATLVNTGVHGENFFTVVTQTTAAAGSDQPFTFTAVGVQ
jgi:hypothetical protein